MLPITDVLRLTRRLHAVWTSRIEPPTEPWQEWKLLETHIAAAQHARQRLRLAASKNLTLILPQLREEVTPILRRLRRQVEQLREAYTAAQVRTPDLCDWVRDLRQLEAEFGAVEVRWSEAVIRVVTEPIVLKSVRLGPFAIDFHWTLDSHSLGVRSFEVIALAPNPASGRDDVAHPHVQDGLLCGGDAVTPLRLAVAAGRLVDAFLLVRSVLSHYNANSPYVSLAEWDGFLCADCRGRGGREERLTCEGCECSLCNECAMTCSACPETRCADCMTPCDYCLDRHCHGCVTQTDDDRAICADCRALGAHRSTVEPSDETLPEHTETEEEEHNDDTEPIEIPAGAAVPEPA